ncbi:GntR family transcriptional regulator [Sodalis praecaptivus]|nr:GntR family transcriptional regulator [Sodalis praecaptivus]
MSTKGTPLYAQIHQHLLDEIASGRYASGAKLPSESVLAQQFGTTRSTVVRALQQLAFEGVISREKGRGTFARAPSLATTLDMSRIRAFEDEIAEKGGAIEYRLLSFNRIKTPAAVAARLGLGEQPELYRLLRLRLVNGIPAVLENRYIPLDIGSRLTIDALTHHSMYSILEHQIGLPVTDVDGLIRVMGAEKTIAGHLQIKPGTPVLVRDYLLSGSGQRPLICGEAYFREQYPIRYHINAPR